MPFQGIKASFVLGCEPDRGTGHVTANRRLLLLRSVIKSVRRLYATRQKSGQPVFPDPLAGLLLISGSTCQFAGTAMVDPLSAGGFIGAHPFRTTLPAVPAGAKGIHRAGADAVFLAACAGVC